MSDLPQVWKPDRPVQIVAGTPPGGGLDRLARAVVKAFSEGSLIDVPIEILNIPGDGARRAWTHYIDNHPADGHIVGVSSPNLTLVDRNGTPQEARCLALRMPSRVRSPRIGSALPRDSVKGRVPGN